MDSNKKQEVIREAINIINQHDEKSIRNRVIERYFDFAVYFRNELYKLKKVSKDDVLEIIEKYISKYYDDDGQ